jgi:hypothetical protein
VQVSGDWRSAKARELDKLGGANREAVKRGSSMKMRLEWLQVRREEPSVKLAEQMLG